MVDAAKNLLNRTWQSLAKTVISAPTESHFEDKGQLTPAEFVEAGDKLVQAAPVWQWKPAASKALQKPELPADKQFLILQRVPSNRRVRDITKIESTLEREVRTS